MGLSLNVVVASRVPLRHQGHLRKVGHGAVAGVLSSQQPCALVPVQKLLLCTTRERNTKGGHDDRAQTDTRREGGRAGDMIVLSSDD